MSLMALWLSLYFAAPFGYFSVDSTDRGWARPGKTVMRRVTAPTGTVVKSDGGQGIPPTSPDHNNAPLQCPDGATPSPDGSCPTGTSLSTTTFCCLGDTN